MSQHGPGYGLGAPPARGRPGTHERRMVAEPTATLGPLGLSITPPGSPSARAQPAPRTTRASSMGGTTRRERDERNASRERARFQKMVDEQEAQRDLAGKIQDWVGRLMAVENQSRTIAQDFAAVQSELKATQEQIAAHHEPIADLQRDHTLLKDAIHQLADRNTAVNQRLDEGTKDLTQRFDVLDKLLMEFDGRICRIETAMQTLGQNANA